LWLAPLALGAGWLIGAVGIGGVLLIPALSFIGGLDIRVAMATALFSFFFTGLAGTVQFQRRGSIDWRSTAPLCLTALVCSVAGAWLASRTDARALNGLLGLIMMFAGMYTAWGTRLNAHTPHAGNWHHYPVLIAIGAFSGLASGLTGVGGPALSVPLMLLAGFSPLTAIGTGQVLQVAAAFSGSVTNFSYGTIALGTAVVVSVFEMTGVWFGVHYAHSAAAATLKKMVAVLCVTVGALLLLRTAFT
jgi:uncharacterized membrane protein YfcA